MDAVIDWLNRREYERMRATRDRLMKTLDEALARKPQPISARDFQVTAQTSLTVSFGECTCEW